MKRGGFTLLEMLLATALLAAGLALAFGILQGASRATVSAETLAAHSDRLRTVQAFLRRQIAQALPQPLDPQASFESLRLLELSADRVSFVATMPGYLARGGAYLQEFLIVPGRGGATLVYVQRLMAPGGPLAPEREPEVLLEGLADARFSARGFGPDGRPTAFEPDWQRIGQLPNEVRLEARFAERRFHFPTLIVPLRYSLSGVVGQVPEAARRDERGEGEQ